MATKWIGFLVFIWVMAAILGCISEGESVLAEGTEEYQTVNDLLWFTQVSSDELWGTLVSPGTHVRFFEAVFKLLMLDFPMWEDYPYSLIRWIIIAPIIATIVFGFVVMFFNTFQRTIGS